MYSPPHLNVIIPGSRAATAPGILSVFHNDKPNAMKYKLKMLSAGSEKHVFVMLHNMPGN